jgi:hypothetical protein
LGELRDMMMILETIPLALEADRAVTLGAEVQAASMIEAAALGDEVQAAEVEALEIVAEEVVDLAVIDVGAGVEEGSEDAVEDVEAARGTTRRRAFNGLPFTTCVY